MGEVARFYIGTLAYTGLRPGELRKAEVDDLDLASWTLRVGHPKGESTYGRSRRVPMPEPLRPFVLQYLRARDQMLAQQGTAGAKPLVCTMKGTTYSSKHFRYLKKKVSQRCGIQFELRALRRTYGQVLLNRGVSIETVSLTLGHASTRTTETYYCRKDADSARSEVLQAFAKTQKGPEPAGGRRLVAVHTQLLTGESRAQTTLLIMGREMRIARAQFDRIESHRIKLESLTPPGPGLMIPATKLTQEEYYERLSMLFGDIHFLLVSMAGISRLYELMKNDLDGEKEFEEIGRKHREMFRKARVFRNHLEHIDDRVRKGIKGLGDCRETLFSFDGKSFDFGPQLRRELEEFFAEVKAAYEAYRKRKGLNEKTVVSSAITV